MAAAGWLLALAVALAAEPTLVVFAGPQTEPRDAPGEYVLSIDVPLVVLHATVRDSRGLPVAGLKRDDVRVFENGVAQPIQYFRQEDVPVTVGLVVDHSGSMGPKIGQVMLAAETFARVSNPRDQMFVVNFNEHVSPGLPPDVSFTDDPGALRVAIESYPTTGRTALYDAVIDGIRRLAPGYRNAKVLIVISDGDDNSSRHTLREVMEAGEKSDATIYSIGLFDEGDVHPNPRLLKKLARRTGGEAYFPSEAPQLVGICERIARDIRSQYTIGYVPTDSRRDGTYRNVLVEARAPGRGRLEVRTRAGYYATAE